MAVNSSRDIGSDSLQAWIVGLRLDFEEHHPNLRLLLVMPAGNYQNLGRFAYLALPSGPA
jgi:hypothetical protein